jgi:predicted HTH domain antitoxin
MTRGDKIMEETKKKAIEKLREQLKADYFRGYNTAIELVADGTINLAKAEELTSTENPMHETLVGESEDFKKGFFAALVSVLGEAKSGS